MCTKVYTIKNKYRQNRHPRRGTYVTTITSVVKNNVKSKNN